MQSQGRRAKSQRGHTEVQCTPTGCNPSRSGSCGPRPTHNSARLRGPRGRSRDMRRGNAACSTYQAMINHGKNSSCVAPETDTVTEAEVYDPVKQEDSIAHKTFNHRPSVGSWFKPVGQDRCVRKGQEAHTKDEEEEEEEEDREAVITNLRWRACDALFQACIDGTLQQVLGDVMTQEKTASANEEEGYDEASDFISGLLQEAVDDYSDEAVYEINHKHEAPRVFDVPEPPIPEEDESMFEEDEEKFAFSVAASEFTKIAFEEAEANFVRASTHDADDVYDCEDVVSVVSCTYVNAEDATEVSNEVAQELVWTEPEKVDMQLDSEGIRMVMKNILEEACDSGKLARMLRELREARDESWPLPSASTLPSCTKPTFARRLQPQPHGAPVMEEPFPCDCLPPTTAVAKPSVPSSKEEGQACLKALESLASRARAIASTNLQHLYREAYKTLENEVPVQKAAPKPAPAKNVATTLSLFAVISRARSVLLSAAKTGKLEKVIDEVVEEKQNDTFEQVRDKMRLTLCSALENGSLEGALQEYKFERVCKKARDVLVSAAYSGQLEVAVREVINEKETSSPAAVVEAPMMAPSPPPEGSPQRRRFAGARTVVASTSAAASPVQPVPPSEPRASTASCGSPRKARILGSTMTPTPTPTPPTTRPTARPGSRPTSMLSASCEGPSAQPTSPVVVPPQTPAPGVRRPTRANTVNGPTEQPSPSKEAPATTPRTPGPLRPSSARRAASQPRQQQACLSARGSGPTALELDLAGAAESPCSSSSWRLEMLENMRLSKGAAPGTGLLPKLPSAPHTSSSVAWSMGLEHSTIQHKMNPSANAHASTTF